MPKETFSFNLNLTLGMLEVGVLLSMFGFGILTSQTYTYYERFRKDSTVMKLLVALVWCIELAHMVCISHSLYTATISSFGNPFGLLVLPGLQASVALSSFGGSVVQSMFSYKIYTFSGKPIIPVICWLLCVLRCVGGVAASVLAFRSSSIPAFVENQSWLLTSLMTIAAATDLLIAASLTFYFRARRADAMSVRSHRILDRLMEYAIENGVVTSITAVIVVILFQTMPGNFVYIMPYVVLARLYSNSLLVSLNSRARLEKEVTRVELSSSSYSTRRVPQAVQSNDSQRTPRVLVISEDRKTVSNVDFDQMIGEAPKHSDAWE